MYECRNCGAGLRFDITTQQLKCDACDSLFDPYGEKKEQDAIEDQYEVNLFCVLSAGAR